MLPKSVRPGRRTTMGTPPVMHSSGGQLLLIGPTWDCALKSSHKDPIGLGVLTKAVLGCTGGDIPPSHGTDLTAPSNKLWDKLQQWLH